VSQILIGEQATTSACAIRRPSARHRGYRRIRILSPSGSRRVCGQLSEIRLEDAASTIYREGNSRYIASSQRPRTRSG